MARINTCNVSVQKTNDFSSVSKLSMCACGYMEDDFLKYVVSKQKRRTPIINRGYFVRMHAVDNLLRRFFEDVSRASERNATSLESRSRANIVVLGAGYDTLYFRLKKNYKSWSDSIDFSFIENMLQFDFDSVCRNKSQMISEELAMSVFVKNAMIFDSSNVETNSGLIPVLMSNEYSLFAMDIRQVHLFPRAFEAVGIDQNLPTIVLAEVVLSYIENVHVMKILETFHSIFRNVIFARYEQIQPEDDFGRFMIQHFKEQNAPLLNVIHSPTIDQHKSEYRNCNWEDVAAISISNYWAFMLSDAEKVRISSLEPFDEFEELLEKCRHYVFALAASGSVTPVIANYDMTSPASTQKLLSLPVQIANVPREFPLLYGHSMTTLEVQPTDWNRTLRRLIVMVGGVSKSYPKRNENNDELKTFFMGNGSEGVWISSTFLDKSLKRPLVHHSAICITSVTPNRIIVFGGRTSPAVENTKVYFLELTVGDQPSTLRCAVQESTLQLTDIPCSFIHSISAPPDALSTTVLRTQSVEIKSNNDFHQLICLITTDKETSNIGVLQIDCVPEGLTCCSATLAYMQPVTNNALGSVTNWNSFAIVSGGYQQGAALKEILLFNPADHTIRSHGTMQYPRFGHTSHVWKNKLVLIGGVSHEDNVLPLISVFDLRTKLQRHYSLDFVQSGVKEKPIVMMFNHASTLLDSEGIIVITGGGGNCFSFGTHFNPFPFYISCSLIENETPLVDELCPELEQTCQARMPS